MRRFAFVACFLAMCAPARADALEQGVFVTRPPGYLAISVDGSGAVTFTDSREVAFTTPAAAACVLTQRVGRTVTITVI